jgi:hypothetical protein
MCLDEINMLPRLTKINTASELFCLILGKNKYIRNLAKNYEINKKCVPIIILMLICRVKTKNLNKSNRYTTFKGV